MKATGFLSMVGVGVLSACGVPSADGGTTSGASDRVPVTVDGVNFAADLRPGPAGERLTAAGAVPTRGRTISVSRSDGGALTYSEGRSAKAAAERACVQAGGRFEAAALGRYAGAGVWTFNGVCA